MADPLTVFAIGDIDELGLRGVVLRGTDPEAIREAGRHLHQPVVVVLVDQWKQVVEALESLDRMNRGLDWCDHDEQARRWSAARRALEGGENGQA